MNSDQIQSFIRGALISAGAGLVEHGIASQAQIQIIAGGVAAVVMIVWGIIQKRESAKLTKAVTVVNKALDSGDAAHAESPVTGAKIVVAN